MTRIYLDLDGVMADFDQHFKDLFGYKTDDPLTDAEWKMLDQHPTFFRDMPPCPGAIEFFNTIKHRKPIVLTACPKTNYARVAKQKREWVREHLSYDVMVLPIMGSHNKPLFMHHEGDILIDDLKKNTDEWTKAGGRSILHTNFSGTHYQLANEIWD